MASKETHPLQNEWSVWEHHECDPKKSASGYSQSMKEIYRFKTVEDFWAFFNNYPKMRYVVVVVGRKKTNKQTNEQTESEKFSTTERLKNKSLVRVTREREENVSKRSRFSKPVSNLNGRNP